ncbi:F0F1 ATP synthase subunit A [Acidaminobacter sp. JC074]|uniref:F0F1 ATP synthase subunit A n=1 Tax=Acidaminobacter sp. JC074 TaxID=2530199 RepID=UPI001F104FDA|nr:F0F1 ATP synthase subunit A [Acidaminobacter sp. JC074]
MNGPEIIFVIPFGERGIPVTQTVTTTWFIMLVLFGLSIFLTRGMKIKPGKKQVIAETIVDGIYNLTESTMGKQFKHFSPYIGTLLLLVGFANISGLLGLRPPTSDLNTTLGLALITFFLIHFTGIKAKGVGGYLKGFLEPMPFLLPINIMGEIATPISLSFRLFGNILGGLIIMTLVYQALGWFSLIPVPAILHMYFDLFAGLLQSFIFGMLTMVFVSLASD